MKNNIKGMGFLNSFLIFGMASLVLFLETHLLIPFLSEQTGIESIVFWLVVAGLGMFFPMLVVSYLLLQSEGFEIGKDTWQKRLRFKKMDKTDWF